MSGDVNAAAETIRHVLFRHEAPAALATLDALVAEVEQARRSQDACTDAYAALQREHRETVAEVERLRANQREWAVKGASFREDLDAVVAEAEQLRAERDAAENKWRGLWRAAENENRTLREWEQQLQQERDRYRRLFERETVKGDTARLGREKAEEQRQQAIDALRAFFAEFDSDSEYAHCAPTDETEARMRAAAKLGEQK